MPSSKNPGAYLLCHPLEQDPLRDLYGSPLDGVTKGIENLIIFLGGRGVGEDMCCFLWLSEHMAFVLL